MSETWVCDHVDSRRLLHRVCDIVFQCGWFYMMSQGICVLETFRLLAHLSSELTSLYHLCNWAWLAAKVSTVIFSMVNYFFNQWAYIILDHQVEYHP